MASPDAVGRGGADDLDALDQFGRDAVDEEEPSARCRTRRVGAGAGTFSPLIRICV